MGVTLALGTTSGSLGNLNGADDGPLNQIGSGGLDAKAALHYLYGLSYIFEVR